ncbi:MAG TPA: hypothetical protein VGB78_10530 [Thermoplasmata archaeon]
MMDKPVDHQKIKWKMKLDYSHAQADKLNKGLDGLQSLILLLGKPNVGLHDFLQQAANFLAKQFRLRSVTIGLRSSDGKYRYEVMTGLREEAWSFQKSLAYSREDFSETTEVYKGEMISKLTKLFLIEDSPFPDDEKDAFNRPYVLGMRRRTVDDWVEGDYLDTHIMGSDGSLIGWIEIVGTVDGKLPDVTVIKWLETISALLTVRIEMKKH